MDTLSKDEKYMKRAINLALLGLGTVSPNPLVGAVVVKDGIILGEGYHEVYGSSHAEVNAIKNASQDVAGATLYCSLEPCCHTNKQTPPCTNLIISSKIKRVVISNLDPNPFVAGKGVKLLREAGVEVLAGVLEKEGSEVNEIFFKYIQTGLPFINIKYAQTLDGKIATVSGDSKWISDEAARVEVHKMRLKYDAVMIGRGTLENDNAKLNIRMGVDSKGKIPYRIVVGSIGKINLDNEILSDEHTEKTILVTSVNDYQEAPLEIINHIKDRKIKVIFAKAKDGKLDFSEVFKKIGELKITSVLVEGGSKLISTLIKDNHYDKITAFICPKIIGNGITFYQDDVIEQMKDSIKFKNVSYKIMNDQIIMNAYPMVKGEA